MDAGRAADLYDAVVVGGGPAGLAAALYLARARYRVLVVEKDTFGGQITITAEVVNYPGVEKTEGHSLTETMRRQALHFGAEFLLAEAQGIDVDGDFRIVRTSRGAFRCFAVLLATGAHPRKVGFEGEETFRGRGVAYCATCDGNFFRDQVVAVVGGGNSALEEALYLSRIASKLYLIHRREGFRAAKVYQDKIHAASDKIELVLDTVVTGLMGEDSLQGLHLKNVKTGEETQLPVDGMFVFVGYEPQNSFLPAGLELDPQGFIITDCEMRTNLPGLFAAGDIRSKMCRQVTTAVGDGATAATAAFTYLEQLDA